MIGFICMFLMLNFLTLKLNQKIIRDYTKIRLPLKIKKQTWGSTSDPAHLYFFLALMLFANLMFYTVIVSTMNIVIGAYIFVILATYVILGVVQLFFKFDSMVSDCENISLNHGDYKVNIFWQIVINLICTTGNFIDFFIKKIGIKINLPNPIPSITHRISKGYKTFDD